MKYTKCALNDAIYFLLPELQPALDKGIHYTQDNLIKMISAKVLLTYRSDYIKEAMTHDEKNCY